MQQDVLREMLAGVIAERAVAGESLADVGRTLAALAGPERRPLSKQYIQMLAAGKARITAELGRAIATLAAMQDGVSALQASAQRVTVPIYATHDLPANVLILDPAHKCKLLGCNLVFVARRSYCSADCRREARRRRRAVVAR